jgi:hypothetical protein
LKNKMIGVGGIYLTGMLMPASGGFASYHGKEP